MLLSEVDQQGEEHQRGVKAMTIPAHHYSTCRDVLVKCIKFVLPEDVDVSGQTPYSMCNTRNFKARVIAHHMESDYACCPLTDLR